MRSFLVLATFLLPLLAGSCTSASLSSPGSAKKGELTVARIFEDPSLDGSSPKSLKFAPDGSRVTYLKGKATDFRKLDLWEFDLKTRENRMLVDSALFSKGATETLSAEEKAQRERRRISDSGIVEYSFSRSGNSIVFPIAGALYFYPLQAGALRAPIQLTTGKFHETDALLSPEGRYVSFVRDSNLYVTDTKTRKERKLTSDGSKTIKNGLAEFIAQEEMDRFRGQWWSDDEKYLAFTRTDERAVEIAKRYEINADGFEVEEQRYPRTGSPNVKMRLGVLQLGKAMQPRWIDLGSNPDIYLARVDWLPAHHTLAVQIETRDQKRLDLFFVDVRTGSKKLVFTEKDDRWLNLTDGIQFLSKKKQFIWASERSGKRQLYLYDLDGNLIRQLTNQPWPVRELLETDTNESQVYFTAGGTLPIEQHLYKTSLDTAAETRVTHEEGVHSVTMPHGAEYFIDTYSNPSQPPQVSVRRASDGKHIAFLEENLIDSKHPLHEYLAGFSTPEFGSFKSAQGIELFYKLIKPRGFQVGHRYPVIVDVYGGPTRQYVNKDWGRKRGLWHQLMAARGFAVFSLDNRGTPERDRDFEKAIYHRLGDLEVQDQAAGVDYLVQQGIADPKRIGIFGWSYGGYMTLMSMLKRPDLFKVGVSVAPVSDWALYDTHYTERYLGTPAENPLGYEESGVLKYASQLKGKLFMVHGMADDNVLFTNSTKVYKAFQDRALPFDMMAYPGSKHGIYGKMPQIHLYESLTRYFEQNL